MQQHVARYMAVGGECLWSLLRCLGWDRPNTDLFEAIAHSGQAEVPVQLC